MSLYSSIDVPSDDKRIPSKAAGFVPLYADTLEQSPQLIAPPVEESVQVQNKPNAALQFAPSSRRRPAPVPKRKAGATLHDEVRSIQNPVLVDSPKECDQAPGRPGDHVPRLEVTNNFDDYADYQPDDDKPFPAPEENRKRSKKNKNKIAIPEAMSWDDEYDPTRPVEFQDYLRSDERQDARSEWQVKKAEYGVVNVVPQRESSPVQPVSKPTAPRMFNFGPPKSKLNFAPSLSADVHVLKPVRTPRNPSPPPPPTHSHIPQHSNDHDQSRPAPPPPPPPAEPIMNETAEEAYLRRASMQQAGPGYRHLQQSQFSALPPPPPPPVDSAVGAHIQKLALFASTKAESDFGSTPDLNISSVPKTTYTAEPTFYAVTPVAEASLRVQDEYTEVSQPAEVVPLPDRGTAPGQKGFASRYMAAQGWAKGQGLGASGSGRLAPLFVKPQKDGKTGKIIDRHKNSPRSSASKMTRIVLLEGMINVGEPIDEFLQQDVGESCSNAYGKVERVKLISETGRVLVKFTDAISALRCMSTVEGREYGGNNVSAKYYSEEAFEKGVWDE